jgi:antitoxin ParD1/3/4
MSKTFAITLPDSLARLLEQKVGSGEYATESDVVSAGLQGLQAHDAVLEHWLQTEVAASYDQVHAEPASVIPHEDILMRVKARYRQFKDARGRGLD